jgi:hypothetical protein
LLVKMEDYNFPKWCFWLRWFHWRSFHFDLKSFCGVLGHRVSFCNELLSLILIEIIITIPESTSNGDSSSLDIKTRFYNAF